jgi:hypothetical protein
MQATVSDRYVFHISEKGSKIFEGISEGCEVGAGPQRLTVYRFVQDTGFTDADSIACAGVLII